MGQLYFPLNFAAKLKLLLKNIFIKTKRKREMGREDKFGGTRSRFNKGKER